MIKYAFIEADLSHDQQKEIEHLQSYYDFNQTLHIKPYACSKNKTQRKKNIFLKHYMKIKITTKIFLKNVVRATLSNSNENPQ